MDKSRAVRFVVGAALAASSADCDRSFPLDLTVDVRAHGVPLSGATVFVLDPRSAERSGGTTNADGEAHVHWEGRLNIGADSAVFAVAAPNHPLRIVAGRREFDAREPRAGCGSSQSTKATASVDVDESADLYTSLRCIERSCTTPLVEPVTDRCLAGAPAFVVRIGDAPRDVVVAYADQPDVGPTELRIGLTDPTRPASRVFAVFECVVDGRRRFLIAEQGR